MKSLSVWFGDRKPLFYIRAFKSLTLYRPQTSAFPFSFTRGSQSISPSALEHRKNLLRLFDAKPKDEESSKDTRVIKAWQKNLAKRVEKGALLAATYP